MKIILQFCLLASFSHEAFALLATDTEVKWTSDLVQYKDGFFTGNGGLTGPGGVKGIIYEVTDAGDYDVEAVPPDPIKEGTFRHALASNPGKPLWIRLGKKFTEPSGQTVVVKLKTALDIKRNDVTLDGRGAKVIFSRDIDWSVFEPNDDEPTACARYKKDLAGNYVLNSQGKRSIMVGQPFIFIRGAEDVIITHFTFTHSANYDSPTYKGQPREYTNKECLNDFISIWGVHNQITTNNFWVNKNSFSRCGDGCVDATLGASGVSHRGSYSYNRFDETFKTMLIGRETDAGGYTANDFPYRISLYRNFFNKTKERTPRVARSIVHMFNNYYYHWGSYITANVPNFEGRIFVEENLLQAGAAPNNRIFYPSWNSHTFLESNRPMGSNVITDNSNTPDFDNQKLIWVTNKGGASLSLMPAIGLPSSEITSKAGNN